MRRASADHAGALEADDARFVLLAAVVTPVVGGGYRAGVGKISRPSSGGERTVIRTGLDQQHGLLGVFREQTRNRRAGGATSDHDGISEARKRRAR